MMTEDEIDYWYDHDSDLAGCLRYTSAGSRLSSAPLEILATITGTNDYSNWHWVLLLKSGAFAYITGGCDYTGWDCQSSSDTYEAESLLELVLLIGDDDRDTLVGQLPEASRRDIEYHRSHPHPITPP